MYKHDFRQALNVKVYDLNPYCEVGQERLQQSSRGRKNSLPCGFSMLAAELS